MRQTLLVAGQELIVNLRRPGFILMTLLIPALGALSLLVASIFGGQVGDYFEGQFGATTDVTGYVDQSGLLTDDPRGGAQFLPYPDVEAARGALLSGTIDSFFVVPPDYLQTGKVVVYGTGSGFSTFAAADSGAIQGFLVQQLLAGRVDAPIEQRILSPARIEAVTLDAKGEVSTESPFSWLSDFVLPYIFAILFVITIFTTSGFLLQGVSEEKEGRIIEILLSSISPAQLLAGKILGLGALGLIQVFVWIGAGAGLVAATASLFALAGVINLSLSNILLGLVYFVLGYLLFATWMAVAGAMGTTQRESQQIAGIFSVAAAIPWMVISFIFTNPNATIAVVLSYIPLTAPVMMLLRLGFGAVPGIQIAISLVLLVLGIAVSLWAGAKIFRAGLLMYGKRPGVREIARAFRQA